MHVPSQPAAHERPSVPSQAATRTAQAPAAHGPVMGMASVAAAGPLSYQAGGYGGTGYGGVDPHAAHRAHHSAGGGLVLPAHASPAGALGFQQAAHHHPLAGLQAMYGHHYPGQQYPDDGAGLR